MKEFKITKLDRIKFFLGSLSASIETSVGRYFRPAIAINIAGLGETKKIDPMKVIKSYHRYGIVFYKGKDCVKPIGKGFFGFGKVKIINTDEIKDEEVKRLAERVYNSK